jgi:hypothetical protein
MAPIPAKGPPFHRRRALVETQDRIYFARRAAEEQEAALAARDPDVAHAHRRMQRAYLERASTGSRQMDAEARVG